MRKPVVVVGLGQLGGVFAHGFLRNGSPVFPVRRGDDMAEVAREVPAPSAVLVAVGEADLAGALASLPKAYRGRVVLVQNELVEADWLAHGLTTPTVVSVWFEKKRDKPLHPIVESPIAGPATDLVVSALATLDIPVCAIEESELAFELARKTVYILTANLAGLAVGGTVGALFDTHRELAMSVARDAITLAEQRAGVSFDAERLLAAVESAVRADPDHVAKGRSAPARLERALAIADEAGLAIPAIRALAERTGG